MEILYDDMKKDVPSDQLHRLFTLVGWSDGSETMEMKNHFNLPFKNSTLVISAWKGDRLIGVVRVLSDKMIRSVIYDVAVDPDFQGQGIGRELVERCMEHYPESEWLVQTKEHISGYYEKLGFKRESDVFLSIPCKWLE